MATKKFVYHNDILDSGISFTVPNQSFTPRQIVEQFASGEIVARENQPTDDFYDDKYDDDTLIGVVDVDDEFLARQHIIDYKISQNESKTSDNVRGSSPEGADKTADGISNSSNMDGNSQSVAEGTTE